MTRLVFANNQGLASTGGGVTILRHLIDDLAVDHDVALLSYDAPSERQGISEITLARPKPGWWRAAPLQRAAHLARVVPGEVVREADVVITLDCHFAAAMHRIRPKRLVHLSLSCTPRQEYLAGAGIQRGLDLLQYAWLERSLLGMADGVIAASNLHARDLRRFTLLPAVTPHILAPVFPSGHADAAVAREDSRGTVTLLSAGRLVPAKNFAAVIDLAARLRELPCRFIIAGDGPERARLQARAERAGVDRRIVFAGNVPDLDMLLSQADIFLHPSRNESFGMVVFEAMRAGVAPVCAAGRVVTACAEFASHGADAVFVDFDNTEAAALTIAALIESPERRSSLGRAAKITAARMLRRPYTAAFRAVLAGLS